MNQAGWTTWGYAEANGEKLRVYKHFGGQIVALPADCSNPYILLSTMNDYLESTESSKTVA